MGLEYSWTQKSGSLIDEGTTANAD